MKNLLSLLIACGVLLAFEKTSIAQILYPEDSDFESPTLAPGGFVIAPDGTPWAFTALSTDPGTTSPNVVGIAAPGGQNLANSQGQALFLQGVSSASQTITLTAASTVSVTFDWEGRAPVSYTNALSENVTSGQDAISISLGGVVLYTGTPTNTGSFDTITTAASQFAAGNYVLSLNGVTSGATTFKDTMTFIDNVQVNTSPVPEPSTYGLLIMSCALLLGWRLRKMRDSQNLN